MSPKKKDWLHRVLASVSGHADRQVPRWHPQDVPAAKGTSFDQTLLTDDTLARVGALNEIATKRADTGTNGSAWFLRDPRVTTALIGASRWSQ